LGALTEDEQSLLIDPQQMIEKVQELERILIPLEERFNAISE